MRAKEEDTMLLHVGETAHIHWDVIAAIAGMAVIAVMFLLRKRMRV